MGLVECYTGQGKCGICDISHDGDNWDRARLFALILALKENKGDLVVKIPLQKFVEELTINKSGFSKIAARYERRTPEDRPVKYGAKRTGVARLLEYFREVRSLTTGRSVTFEFDPA